MTNRQIQHELELSRLATDKIRNDLQKAKDKKYSSKQPFIQDIIRDLTFPFKDALVKATSRTSIRKATTTPYALGYKPMQDLFSLVDPDVVAFISITKILDEFYVTNHNLPIPSEAARRIASSLEDEHRIQYYLQSGVEGVEKALYKETHTKGSTPAYMRTGAKLSAEKLLLNKYGWDKDDLHKPWGNDTRFNVGLFVLEAAVEFGMLEKITLQLSKKKKRNHLKLSPTAEALAKKYQQHFEERTIFKHPLIDTPKEWETQYGLSRDNISGGYYQAVFKQYLPLCRDFNSETSFSKDTINLLNTLGRTAWNIDNDVYKIARDCFDKGWTVAGLNSVSHPAILDEKMPQWIVDKGKKDPEYKDWKSTKAHAYTKKKEEESKSVSTRKALVLASEYIKEPRFYLSWSCDYRGRMYSQQSFLDQQKNDSQRALVTFADGCRLDERGMNWAANAIGAAYRGSKITYKDRSDWTYSNKELIAAIANDPLGTLGEWERVDAPWQFLQLAMEWNRVVLKKDKAIWDVPIGADSTSSGLQLLSAMRRDPVGMKFSNLLAPSSSSEPPQDAYKEVMRISRQIAYKNPETARLTEYLEDRALGKVILMKIIYGATSQTNIREVKEYFIDKGLYGFTVSWEDVLSITKILLTASKQVFPSAFESLKFINQLFNAAKSNGSKSFTWSTPNLDNINLNKVKYETRRIDTGHLGRITIPLSDIKEPNFNAMKTALAPNFVHSYDACLLKTSFQEWNQPLALIHDQIKVLPNDMDKAMDRLRKGFVHICSGDPLAKLADDLWVPKQQVKRLEQGTGCLEDVLDSAYMFN